MDAKCSNCYKENRDKCDDYKPKMSAKEAINILAKMQNYDSKENVEALEIAISALEKVEALEAENARLRERETPKEVIFDSGNRLCGECMEIIKAYESYCPFCGQAIKNDKE